MTSTLAGRRSATRHRIGRRSASAALLALALPLRTHGAAPAVPVLTYHRFADTVLDSMTLRRSTFDGHLAVLRALDCRVIRLADLVDWRLGRGPAPPPRAVAITADDGHRSQVELMAPRLAQRGWHATLFVYPSAVSNASYALRWADLRAMAAETGHDAAFALGNRPVSGSDVLHANHYAALAGRRIALLTHAAAIDRVPEPQVIAMRGYRREAWFDQTGLDWVAPSPNRRRPAAALLYPGVAWIEGANVSVGRGTPQPFERIGAPWLDGARLAEALRAQDLAGLDVQPVTFTPVAAPFAGQPCRGVALRVTDRERFDAQRLGAALVRALWRASPDEFRIERTLGNVGSAAALQALQQDQPLDELLASWAADCAAFMRRREAALLY